MSFLNDEYFIINRETSECFELGPGNWKQVFGSSVAPNFTLDKALKHVYKSASGSGLMYVENVVKTINNWIFNSEAQLELIKSKITDKPGLQGFEQTGSRFGLVAPTIGE